MATDVRLLYHHRYFKKHYYALCFAQCCIGDRLKNYFKNAISFMSMTIALENVY